MIAKDEIKKRIYRLVKPLRDDGFSFDLILIELLRRKENGELEWFKVNSKGSLTYQYAEGKKLLDKEPKKPWGVRILPGEGLAVRTIQEYETLEQAALDAIMDAKESD